MLFLGTKSALLTKIKNVHKCENNTFQQLMNSENSKVCIIDGMALVHKIQLKKYNTFGDFAAAFFQNIQNLSSQRFVKRIDVVFDGYADVSIKFIESQLRSKGIKPKQIIISSPSTKVPADCKVFFSCSQNKLQLVQFLCQYAPTFLQINSETEIFISGGYEDPTKCFKLQDNALSEVIDLKSNHLEADCRMFSHIFHAVRGGIEDVFIKSADTDIFVIAVHFWHKLSSIGCRGLWFEGSNKKENLVSCHLAAVSLGENICKILPALHALTGCDTTSRFGTKKQCLNAASEVFVQDALFTFGNDSETPMDINKVEEVCTYLFAKQRTTADELRYKLITRNIGFNLNLARVICTSDALYLHCLRAAAQTYIWKNSSQPLYEPLNFVKFGYELQDGKLQPTQMTKLPLPQSLMKPCKCNADCRTMACTCKKSDLNCISLCKCINNDCQNLPVYVNT